MKDTTLSVETLLKLKKDFDEMFPPIDMAPAMASLAFHMHERYGFKIVPNQLPNDTLAVSAEVYMLLLGMKKPTNKPGGET